jgi:aminoglycoside phosphotransferase family enzyme/predicted kinase
LVNLETQHDAIEFLSRPEAYGNAGPVERIDTHISIVFLVRQRAYKLKRAVTFPYVDYASLELRRAACEREVRLNRRTAPDLYRAVVAVARGPDGRLTLGGHGEPIEWLVEMARFDDSQLLDRLAAAGRLDVQVVSRLAAAVAHFHEGAMPRRDHGGTASMRSVVEGNRVEMLGDAGGTLDRDACSALCAESFAAIERLDVLLEARRMHGLVRQCHGDLHLHNVFLRDGAPTLFDAIEFNDELACIDVMYDFAFLLMDLVCRGLPRHGNAALNAYFETRPDFRGLTLLPLFLSCRAAIRAKVDAAAAAVQQHRLEAARLRTEAQAYLTHAQRLLRPSHPTLVAIGGLSGSGKSTLAASLAPSVGPAPGAVIVRSDVIRKEMFGVEPTHRLPDSAYVPEVSAEVYARALHAAEACVRSGHAAIVDAVFAEPGHRRAVERMAAEAGVPFTGIWLDVPYDVATRRLESRRADASDATPSVLRAQADRAVGDIAWTRLDGRGHAPDSLLTLDDLVAPARA